MPLELTAQDERTLSDDKWVRLMCDFCADGLWAKGGEGVDDSELPVSDELKARIRAWQDTYERHDGFVVGFGGPLPRGPAHIAFAAEGEAIARAVKAELPDWTVFYFNEALCRFEGDAQPRSEFEYEIA